jgi:hypothetical protein
MSADTTGVLQLASNNGTVGLTMDTSQNVGIGTTSPATKLQVTSSAATVNAISMTGSTTAATYLQMVTTGGTFSAGLDNSTGSVFGNAAYSANFYYSGAYPMLFWTSGTERMRIDSSGIVLMGTTDSSNTTRLKIVGGSTTDRAISSQLSVQRAASNQYEGISFVNGVATSAYILRRPSSDDLTFGFDAGGATAEKMRLDTSGNLLIGQTTYGGGVSSGGLYLRNAIAANGGSSVIVTHNSSVGNGNSYAEFWYGASNTGAIVQNSTTTVAYNTTSDYRLKENVQPMVGALNIVSQLKPVTYDWISDKSKGQGFIAHELQAFVPDCVTGEKDAINEDGTIKPQQIDTSFLVATLTAAIQELNAKVDAQAALIATLQAKVGT